uniref:RGS domain-containing protein n=1 Tax=Parascaris univalens TaxID=6257 RepID=A0A915C0I9_PARUN
MALPSDFTLRQSSALSSHGGMRGLMDAVLERRSLRSRQICSREQLKKYAPRICHAEVGRMQIKSPSKDLEDPTIVAPSESRQQNEDLNASFSRSNRNVQLNVEKSRTKAKKTHCRELSLSRKIVSKSRRRSSSLTAVFDGPYERVVANEKQPTEEASLCTGAYLHRAFSLRTTSSEREGKLASYRRRRGDACSSITTHSVSIDTGVPREIHPYFVVPLPVNNDFKPGKQQRFQEDISRADTDVACPQKLVVSAKQGNENGVIPRTILSPRDVHLVECRNTSEYQSSSQHATRSSMRCSRQRRRYNTQTESFGVNAPRFERGIVQLRDSRRRTAEIMRQRRSQPDMSVHSDEQLLQQSDFHAATKVKFLNDDKPTVMNKWIRAAKTSSAYANIAFEKSSILSKHDAEQSKLHSLERDKSHSVIASQRNLTKNKTSAHQEPHRESGQTQRGGVLMVGGSVCESKKKRRLKSSNGNTAAERSCDVQKNIQNLQSHMEGLSLNSLPVSKVFRTLNVMKEKYLLQSILYADSEPDSLSDKENIIPRKILSARAPQAADDCRSGGNDCICHQEILQLNRRSISNYLQEMDNLQLVDYSSDVEDGLHSNARLKSASSDCITWISKKNIIEDEMKDCLKICKVHDVGDIDIDSKPSSCTTSTERTSHSSSSKKHSSSWFVPLNGEGRVCEVLCANNPHSSLNVMVINDEKEDANDGDLCDHECDDHVNAIASFSDGERSRHRKQIVSTDERGENAAAWPRPRGREVLANVAVEERILSQQCADRPVINPATQTLTATQQSDPHPSDLLKQSLLQSDHFVEDCSKKREDRVLEIKEYVEKREAGSKAPNTSNPPPLADTPNSMTVQERVGEPECEPMANGEHTQASGLCSDRSSSDVERILHNPVYRRPFQQFLEQQFCAENINFYVAVEEYRSIP